ncbi:hypothetical protein [Streptomyces sp. H51]|nr:hypothetical protein [Streptomyces sp. H51]
MGAVPRQTLIVIPRTRHGPQAPEAGHARRGTAVLLVLAERS